MGTQDRKVVIAVDGSSAAENAFETYMRTLKYQSDTVILFTCQELDTVISSFWKGGTGGNPSTGTGASVFNYNPDVLHEKLEKEEMEKKNMLKPYEDRLQEAGIKSKSQVLVTQNPGYSIVATAQNENADLIVMGCRGHSALTRTLIGSVSDYVVKHSDIPVVVCRASC